MAGEASVSSFDTTTLPAHDTPGSPSSISSSDRDSHPESPRDKQHGESSNAHLHLSSESNDNKKPPKGDKSKGKRRKKKGKARGKNKTCKHKKVSSKPSSCRCGYHVTRKAGPSKHRPKGWKPPVWVDQVLNDHNKDRMQWLKEKKPTQLISTGGYKTKYEKAGYLPFAKRNSKKNKKPTLRKSLIDGVNRVKNQYQKTVMKDEVHRNRFGGSLVLAVKNFKHNKNKKMASYKDLGFDIIDRRMSSYDDTLVKMVRDRIVTIHSVITKTKGGNPYLTVMDIENECAQRLNAFIPRGSLVAEQDAVRKVQNLCTKTDNNIILKPYQRKKFKLDSFCTDSDFDCPAGESANFTSG